MGSVPVVHGDRDRRPGRGQLRPGGRGARRERRGVRRIRGDGSQQRDRDALRAGLLDGTIDALVSDHTPVDEDAKTLPFAESEPGATGVELLLSLALKWSQDSGVSLARALAVVTHGPAAVLGASLGKRQASTGRLLAGGAADLCVFDPAAAWTVQSDALRSQGKYTPFSGYELPGRVRCTIMEGRIAFGK